MEKVIKQDDAIMKSLGLKTINRIICNTDKGYLTLQIRKGEKNYHLVLDAVPLNEETNKELMGILFPVATGTITMSSSGQSLPAPSNYKMQTEVIITKKSGRPKGSKNK